MAKSWQKHGLPINGKDSGKDMAFPFISKLFPNDAQGMAKSWQS
jgi:hypothetical protein